MTTDDAVGYELFDFGPVPADVLESFSRLGPSGVPGIWSGGQIGPVLAPGGAIELPPARVLNARVDEAAWYLQGTVMPTLVGEMGGIPAEATIIAWRIEPDVAPPAHTARVRHQDGADFIAVMVCDRVNVAGGSTRLFATDDPAEDPILDVEIRPGQVLLFDDKRQWHDRTPFTAAGPGPAYRDFLILSFTMPDPAQ